MEEFQAQFMKVNGGGNFYTRFFFYSALWFLAATVHYSFPFIYFTIIYFYHLLMPFSRKRRLHVGLGLFVMLAFLYILSGKAIVSSV